MRAFFLAKVTKSFPKHMHIKPFAKSESGSVAIDWLLLTATAIGLAIGGLTMIQSDTTDVSDSSGDAQSLYTKIRSP